MPQDDPFYLQRFIEAQQSTYNQARSELAAGEKRSHWMWFIFPQIAGLGSSPTAQRYAISDLAEAKAYLAHPLLGPRLRECTALVNAAHSRSLAAIFGYPDNLKFHSSITLFAEGEQQTGSQPQLFRDTLALWFEGRADRATLKLLG